ncbi:unnamed protein product [Gongylonema pulchrum]|uniref:PDZ domain-containing protein n=1 Tax=Gongylonema pulchrum TaxID=637853 RepID=A0A183CUK1_9BILA|nr:unnamed protein product [Gongylonema pulchrum]
MLDEHGRKINEFFELNFYDVQTLIAYIANRILILASLIDFIRLSPSTASFGRTLLENLTRSPLSRSLTSLDKTKLWSKFYVDEVENVQVGFKKVLDRLSVDQKVITNPRANRRRRTVVVTRNDGQPFGFTLQTYVLKRKGEELPSKVTYVDYVQLDSPASDAGIRAGDVLISINGRVVTGMSHRSLIELIGSCRQMRMVVIFENIRQRIELIARAIKLRKVLNDKLYQLNLIDIEEQKILNRAYVRTIATRRLKRSFMNSLSSAGTSSASSVNSVPSDAGSGGTISGSERSIIRIPSICVSASNGATTEIDRCPLRRPTNLPQRRSLCEIFNGQSTKSSPDSLRLTAAGTEMELPAIQRIRCFGVNRVDSDNTSFASVSAGETTSTSEAHDILNGINADDIDNGDNDNARDDIGSAVEGNTFKNIGDNGDDDDGDGASASANGFDNANAGSGTANADKLSKQPAFTEAEEVFDSVALNHVILLDDDELISSDNEGPQHIRVLKL